MESPSTATDSIKPETGLTPERLLGLTVSCLAARYDEPKPVPQLHMEMWAYCCSDHPQVAIAAPRNHAKSTALTFAYALGLLLFRESQHLMIISSNESLATEFLNDIKVELQENELLMSEFGPYQFLRDRDTEIVVRFHDGHKFRVICKGSNQRMRGLKWERKRPDTVLCDDLEDDEIVLNEERRDRFIRWFYGALKPIVRAGGKIRLYGTILHTASLLAKTMASEKGEHTVHTPLRTYSTDPDRPWLSILYRAHDESYDEILWPEQFSEKDLKRIRADFAQIGLLDVYGQEYLNNPVDQNTAYFRRDDFLPMTEGDREVRKVHYVGVDLAISQKTRSAFTCFVVGGVDHEKKLHIVDVRRDRWDSLEIVNECFNLYERYDFDLMRFESEQIERTMRPVLEAEMVRRQVFFNFDSKPPLKDKEARSRAFQYRMRAGNVKFDKEASWYADFEEELVHFPKWPYMDQVDAAAWLGDLISEELQANTDAELEEWEYERMRESDTEMGACSITGY